MGLSKWQNATLVNKVENKEECFWEDIFFWYMQVTNLEKRNTA